MNLHYYQVLISDIKTFSNLLFVTDLELREDIDTILMPNMVVSMEPMIMIPEGLPGAGGYREHDILVVTSDGAINITGFPFGPEHNVIKA